MSHKTIEASTNHGKAVHFDEHFSFIQPERSILDLHKFGKLSLTLCKIDFAVYHYTLLFQSLKEQNFYNELLFDHFTLASKGVHGPFNVKDLQPAHFELISFEEFEEKVLQIVRLKRWQTPAATNQTIAKVQDLCSKAGKYFSHFHHLTTCQAYNQRDALSYPYAHPWAHSINEFHEFVLVNPQEQQMALVNCYFE